MMSLMFTMLAVSASAAVYKGQREYVRNCISCHTTGQDFVYSKTSLEWRKFMAKKGDRLKSLHINSTNPEAKGSDKYFNSKAYEKNTRHLQDFLIEYAKDSGRIPACN
ncbi:MAG: cytochrome C [Sulfuricurvum sp.]